MAKKKTIAQIDSLIDAHLYFIDDLDLSIAQHLLEAKVLVDDARKKLRAMKGFPRDKERALSDFGQVGEAIDDALRDIDTIGGNLGAAMEEAIQESKVLAMHYDPKGYRDGDYPNAR